MSSKFKRILKRTAIGIGLLIGLLLTVNGVLAWRARTPIGEQAQRTSCPR